jgi:hypothetical protein
MKIEEPAEQFLTTYRPTPWDQLPDLGLYMDQVVLYIDQRCRPLYTAQKNFITKAMINNYVKCGLVDRPTGKKYDRIQLAQLMMLCTLKQAASLDEMKQLITPLGQQSVQDVYAGFCETQNQVVEALAARPPEATAMEYAIEAAAFRILCAEKLVSEQSSLIKAALKADLPEVKHSEA